MEQEERNLNDRKIRFAIIAIEAGAKKLNISPAEMSHRLDEHNLITERLFKHYDILHTQSINWVADDIVETLQNREEKSRKGDIAQ